MITQNLTLDKKQLILNLRYESDTDLIELYKLVKTNKNIDINLIIWYLPHFIELNYNYCNRTEIPSDYIIDFINDLHLNSVCIFDADREAILGRLHNSIEIGYGDVSTLIDKYPYLRGRLNVAKTLHTLARYELNNGVTSKNFIKAGNSCKTINYIATYYNDININDVKKLYSMCDELNLVITHYDERILQLSEYFNHVYTSNSNIDETEASDYISVFRACSYFPQSITEKQEWETILSNPSNNTEEWKRILRKDGIESKTSDWNDGIKFDDTVEIKQLKSENSYYKLMTNFYRKFFSKD